MEKNKLSLFVFLTFSLYYARKLYEMRKLVYRYKFITIKNANAKIDLVSSFKIWVSFNSKYGSVILINFGQFDRLYINKTKEI